MRLPKFIPLYLLYLFSYSSISFNVVVFHWRLVSEVKSMTLVQDNKGVIITLL